MNNPNEQSVGLLPTNHGERKGVVCSAWLASGNQRPMCERCKARGKTWSGDDPICALAGDNWKCATINAVREIADSENERVDFQYCGDQKYATLRIDQCEDAEGNGIGLALWVSWYKSRGRTDALWILSDNQPPRKPTMDELEVIIASFANTQLRNAGGGEASQTL